VAAPVGERVGCSGGGFADQIGHSLAAVHEHVKEPLKILIVLGNPGGRRLLQGIVYDLLGEMDNAVQPRLEFVPGADPAVHGRPEVEGAQGRIVELPVGPSKT
jgi:hypothetical protein